MIEGDDLSVEIWNDDVLERTPEGQLLISFLTRISRSGHNRDWSRAYTLAVDAGYGAGKTFF